MQAMLCRPRSRDRHPVRRTPTPLRGVSLSRRRATLARWLPTSACALLLPACLVREKCFADADCTAPEVCNAVGECELQCRQDSDCDEAFGVEYVCDCESHRCTCEMPGECKRCENLAHADSSCVHGVCTLDACEEGFYDINADWSDGCEYACTPSSAAEVTEPCDRKDNDCDGEVDEDTDLDSDVAHCGSCGHACLARPNADPVCSSGECHITCHDGWHDNNLSPEDGCEASACVPAEEVCDGKDNDCDCSDDTNGDGVVCGPGDDGVDEGFDKTQPSSCGPFCDSCDLPHATAACVDGECQIAFCEEGWHNADKQTKNGCELACTPSADGVEVCDGQDNDCDGDIDEGLDCESPACPDDMVMIGTAFCIDRYEASRADATATSAGSDESVALSRPGVLPWMVNPLSADHFETFKAACAAAGKRICEKDEWVTACTGPNQTLYVYGSVFDREACNCVDTYCDDYCEEQSIAPESCNTASNCGYDYYCFHEVPTGTFPECTNEDGTFDINGNVWEVVPSDTDARGYEVRGGAFNCASPSVRVNCSFNATWSALYAGFRCCASL